MNPPVDASGPTRETLIRAGRALFALRGYDGTSVRAITRDAGANLGAVTYHFGSKQGLYEAVLERALGGLMERVRRSTVDEDPLDRVGTVIRTMFDYLGDNPDLPQLMLQEIAAGKAPPPPVVALLGTIRSVLGEVIRAGQARGTIRDGVPELMAISTVIQPVHLTLVRGWLEPVMGIDMTKPEDRARVVEHAVDFACAALRKEEMDR